MKIYYYYKSIIINYKNAIQISWRNQKYIFNKNLHNCFKINFEIQF